MSYYKERESKEIGSSSSNYVFEGIMVLDRTDNLIEKSKLVKNQKLVSHYMINERADNGSDYGVVKIPVQTLGHDYLSVDI